VVDEVVERIVSEQTCSIDIYDRGCPRLVKHACTCCSARCVCGADSTKSSPEISFYYERQNLLGPFKPRLRPWTLPTTASIDTIATNLPIMNCIPACRSIFPCHTGMVVIACGILAVASKPVSDLYFEHKKVGASRYSCTLHSCRRYRFSLYPIHPLHSTMARHTEVGTGSNESVSLPGDKEATQHIELVQTRDSEHGNAGYLDKDGLRVDNDEQGRSLLIR